MPMDYSDPGTQKFMIERNIQDNLHGVKWFLKHKDEMIRRAQYTAKNKHYTDDQIRKVEIEASIEALSNQHKTSSRHRRKNVLTDSADATALNHFFMKIDEPSVMKPVDANESNILYKELAAGGGRKAYLNARKRKLPEDKYYSCETSNVYGWALKESLVGFSAPKYKRYASFTHDLTRYSGVHPDPSHYQPPADLLYKSCIGFE